ncbi:type VII secretion target [Glycomyces sp. NPDC048151]|uniref:type VII secretion target n=1 Tax=Glycomyces sp. NPDC048151 TaxID=3364002 RepID=UPI003715D70A
MSEILVDPDGLRTGAQKTRATAPKMTAMTPKVGRGANTANQSNSGYFTGEAAKHFSDRFEEAMTSLKDSIETQTDLIKRAADTWADADEAAAKDLNDLATEFDR